MKLDYNKVAQRFAEKYSNDLGIFASELEMIKSASNEEEKKSLRVAYLMQAYIDTQTVNIVDMFTFYAKLVNKSFDKFTIEIETLKQQNKEMQQIINNLMANNSNKN